jgi:hypothetical protein
MEDTQNPSEGGEWETAVIAVLRNGRLPKGYVEKTPLVWGEGGRWSISLESFKDDNFCPYALEVQLGPFYGPSDTKFDTDNMDITCQELAAVWDDIIRTGRVMPSGPYAEYGPIDVFVTYDTTSLIRKIKDGANVFRSCESAAEVYEKGVSENLISLTGNGVVSTRDIDYVIGGSSQMTIGIKLEKVPDMYSMIFKLNPSAKDGLIEKRIYLTSRTQILFMGEDISLALYGFIILVNSHIFALILYYKTIRTNPEGQTSRNPQGGHKDGTKGVLYMKNRSNLMTIFTSLSDVDKDEFAKWWSAVVTERGIHEYPSYIQLSLKYKNYILGFLNQFYEPKIKGYTIVGPKIPGGKYSSNISKFIIVDLPENDKARREILENYNISEPFWTTRPYEQIEDDDVGRPPGLKLKKQGRERVLDYVDVDSIKNFDMGEWTMFEGGIIHIELRRWQHFVLMSGDVENPTQRSISIHKFCNRLSGISRLMSRLFEDQWYMGEFPLVPLNFTIAPQLPVFPAPPLDEEIPEVEVRRSGRARESRSRDTRDMSPVENTGLSRIRSSGR